MTDIARPPRRTEIRQQNETLILQAAEKVFAEAGFGGRALPPLGLDARVPSLIAAALQAQDQLL